MIEYALQEALKIMQTFSQNTQHQISAVTKSSIQKIQNIGQQSVYNGQQAGKILQSLNIEANEQFDLFHKIGSSAEFSPLIKAARGRQVDVGELRHSVVRALDIMISRLDNTMNGVTKNRLQQARSSLQSESLIFN